MKYNNAVNLNPLMNSTLPEGMEYDENGNVIWEYNDGKEHMCVRLER